MLASYVQRLNFVIQKNCWRKISRHFYYFIKKSNGSSVTVTVRSTKYCQSPIPSGGLVIALLGALNRKHVKYEDNNDEEEITITDEQSNLFMYTVSSEEDNEIERQNEEDCDN